MRGLPRAPVTAPGRAGAWDRKETTPTIVPCAGSHVNLVGQVGIPQALQASRPMVRTGVLTALS